MKPDKLALLFFMLFLKTFIYNKDLAVEFTKVKFIELQLK